MNKSDYRFSIIIPLEFHRGQLEACLRGWVQEQDYPRQAYEIVAAGCRHSLNPGAIAAIRAELGPHDRLLLFEEHHDMALVAQAAGEAGGQVLIFTESHCMPDPGLLSRAEQTLQDHPDWAGFSGRSTPITHNRLSELEASMYVSDIDHGMMDHPWRKINDQIFVVKNGPYQEAGGFHSTLGHFAEWYLAARMHWLGHVIGYAPQVLVRHYYVGDDRELVEFSADFIDGEMTHQMEYSRDPFFHYFPQPDDWLARHSWSPDLAHPALKLAWRMFTSPSPGSSPFPTLAAGRLRVLLSWFGRAVFGIDAAAAAAFIKSQAAIWALRIKLLLPLHRQTHYNALIRMIGGVVRLTRLRRVRQWLRRGNALTPAAVTPAEAWEWYADSDPPPFRTLGVQSSQEGEGTRFRRTGPVVILEIPLPPGAYRFTMNYLPLREPENLKFYVNEQPVPVRHTGGRVTGVIPVTAAGSVTRFSWTCDPWMKAGVSGRLGLPLLSFSCQPDGNG